MPPSPSHIIAARKQTSKPLARAFQLWPTAAVHFHWQILRYLLDEVVTTFCVDSDNFLSHFSTLFTTPPVQETDLFFQPLFAKSLLHTGRRECVCCVPSLFIVGFVSSSCDCIPVTRSFWLVVITSAFIVNFLMFCLSCPSVVPEYL